MWHVGVVLEMAVRLGYINVWLIGKPTSVRSWRAIAAFCAYNGLILRHVALSQACMACMACLLGSNSAMSHCLRDVYLLYMHTPYPMHTWHAGGGSWSARLRYSNNVMEGNAASLECTASCRSYPCIPSPPCPSLCPGLPLVVRGRPRSSD